MNYLYVALAYGLARLLYCNWPAGTTVGAEAGVSAGGFLDFHNKLSRGLCPMGCHLIGAC